MNKSEKYLKNLTNNLEVFDRTFRYEIVRNIASTIKRVKDLISRPSTPFTFALKCVTNSDRGYRLRTSSVQFKHQRLFSYPFNKAIQSIEINQNNVDKVIYTVILNRLFPNLTPSDIEKIFHISTNMDVLISYENIRKIIRNIHLKQ